MTRKHVKGLQLRRPGAKAGAACEAPGCKRTTCSRWLSAGRCCTTPKCQKYFGVGKATLRKASTALVTAVVAAAAAPVPAPVVLPDFAEAALRAADEGYEVLQSQLQVEKEAHTRCRGRMRMLEKSAHNANDVVRRMLLALVTRSLTPERERLGVDEACELSGLDFATLRGWLVVRGEQGVRYVTPPTGSEDASLYPRGYFVRG